MQALMRRLSHHFPQRLSLGFTLIELMVAIAIMAVLATLSWRGLDSMSRVQQSTAEYSQNMLTLQTALAQWRTDLDAVLPDAGGGSVSNQADKGTSPLDWNGNTLRILRRASHVPVLPTGALQVQQTGMVATTPGTMVVAWTLRKHCPVRKDSVNTDAGSVGACWMRWQSPVLRTAGEQQTAWQQAALWAVSQAGAQQNNASMEQFIVPAQQWQVYFFRDNAWVNPQSTAGQEQEGRTSTLPDAVRLVLTLGQGSSLSGDLTVDWISPTLVRRRD